MTKRLSWLAVLLLAVSSVSATSAYADSFGLSASQAFGLSENQVISVKVNGLPADKGIYVVECVLDAGKLSSDPKDCTSVQNTGSVLWLSASPGGADASAAQNFKILRTINGKDCNSNSCALVTSRDHVDRSDRTYDSITPIAVSAISFSLNKSSSLVDAGDELSVSVAGLGSDKGVYVRQCAIPTDGTRPTKCDNAGAVWASNDAGALNLGAVDAGKDVALKVKGHFTDKRQVTDCQLTACGVYVERDWNGLTDRTLDTLSAITFAPPIKVNQAVSRWKKAPSKLVVKVGKSVTLARKSVQTIQGNSLAWSTNKPKVCRVIQTRKLVKVVAVKPGKCVVTAKAPETSRTLATTFTWKVKVSK